MVLDTSAASQLPRKPRSLRSLVLVLGIAFIAGIAAMGWGLSRWDGARHWLFGSSDLQTPNLAYKGSAAIAPVPAPVVTTPDLASRMASIEARMAHLEAAENSAGAGSTRAEALLVTFAARRAIDRGLGLGYVEGLLTERFGVAQPRAVGTIIAAARQPATLDQLRAGLNAVGPELARGAPDQGWWAGVKEGFSGVFVVRKSGTASPDPAARTLRAAQLVDSGRVDLALIEVLRLPNRDRAAAWIIMARRYVEAHRALDLLEAAAITSTDRAQTIPEPAPSF